MARSLRFQSGLPIHFWGECILAATFLINKLPTPVLHYKSPHELLFGHPPRYDALKFFGCLAYASIHPTDKFSS